MADHLKYQQSAIFSSPAVVILLFAILLAACTGPAWEQNPDAQAARATCAGPPEADRYACIERHATERLNPDVCRLTGMWVDDMCLQAVYQVVDVFVHLSAPAPSTSTVGIVRYPQPAGATVGTVLDEVLHGGEGPCAIRTQTLTVSGQPAVQVFLSPHEDGRPDTFVLVADPTGEWWTLDGYGELVIFDQIVGTLRWLPRSLPDPTTTPAGTPVASSVPFTCASRRTPGSGPAKTSWNIPSPGPTRPAASRSTVGARIPAPLHRRRILHDPVQSRTSAACERDHLAGHLARFTRWVCTDNSQSFTRRLIHMFL